MAVNSISAMVTLFLDVSFSCNQRCKGRRGESDAERFFFSLVGRSSILSLLFRQTNYKKDKQSDKPVDLVQSCLHSQRRTDNLGVCAQPESKHAPIMGKK